MAENNTSFNSGFGLPPEYQAELEAMQRRRMMAQALQQQAMQPMGTEVVGGRAVKQSPLLHLARALTGYVAGNSDTGYAKQGAELVNKAGGEARTEFGQLAGMQDPQARIAAMLVSRFPGIQQQGAALQKDYQARLLEAGKVAGAGPTPQAGINMLATGRFGEVPPAPEPVVGTAPGGESMVTNTGAHGVKTGHLTQLPARTEVKNILPGAEGKSLIDFREKELPKWQNAFDSAKGLWVASQRALEAMQAGADPGGGGDVKQAVRAFLQFVGKEVPENASMQDLASAMGKSVLENAEKLRPVSNVDITNLAKMLGGPNTDPASLMQGLSILQATTFKAMQDFGKFHQTMVDTTGQWNHSPDKEQMQMLLSTLPVGREAPGGLVGPQSYQLEVARQLHNQGYDISQLKGLPPQFLADLQKPGTRIEYAGAVPATKARAEKLTVPPAPAPSKPPGVSDADWAAYQQWKAAGAPGLPK